MPPPQATGFACTTCGRQYQHSSHLRRHEATHTASEEFRCRHCGKTFGRRDVWRKHYSSCPSNSAHDEPPPAKRGKKSKACDACFRSKLSCDGSPPCTRCKARQVTCTYTRAHGNDSNESSVPPEVANDTESPIKDEHTKIPISFLLGLTNPKAESMVEVFLDEPSRDIDAPSVELQPDTTNINTDPHQDMTPSDGLFFPWAFDQTDPEPFPDLTSFPQNSSPEDIDPALQPLLTDLASLHTTLLATDPSSYTGGTFTPALANQVFTLSNRDIFVSTYFRHTHKHLPLIHRPSFNVETSSPALVLAVYLCGACCAPPRDCVLAVRGFFHIAEEYMFRKLEGLIRDFVEAQSRSQSRGQGGEGSDEQEVEVELYETFQAAVLIQGAGFLMNSPGPAARRQSWMVRTPALVEGVRRLGLTRARHMQEGGLATIYEMTADLPALQQLWEANDATEFEAAITANGKDSWRRTASLRDCMDALMADPWPGAEGFPLKYISLLDLHLVISALHVMISAAGLMSLLQTSTPALQRATDRWQELWDAAVSHINDEQLRISGFPRHSGEYYWLARGLLKYSLEGKDKSSPYYRRIGHETPKELHDLLRELRGL
ncbi:hypothetical protein C8A01DRAFT_16525 [Parachaetomium inaequale]|uniref:Zn(2)-C6 fungal-type domain-containing protein n=1 Tax=Parachaetomium inaequale TaxID=2588326 RepID=A0AAN6PG59_9PEZI|nr:hypothetical protein C8A01DRAFT_16525 [Parachaetomium inaequale]